MKRYYQGEDIPFSIPCFGEFQNVENFSEFSEIRAYAYTDSCLIQKFSTIEKAGYEKLTLLDNVLSGIISHEYTTLFAPISITVELIGIKADSILKYDIGKKIIGSLKKSLIKIEKSEGTYTLRFQNTTYNSKKTEEMKILL